MAENLADAGGEGVGLEGDAGIAGDFGILRRIAIEHQGAAAHGFDEGGMRAAHFGGVDVGEAMGIELVIAGRRRWRRE